MVPPVVGLMLPGPSVSLKSSTPQSTWFSSSTFIQPSIHVIVGVDGGFATVAVQLRVVPPDAWLKIESEGEQLTEIVICTICKVVLPESNGFTVEVAVTVTVLGLGTDAGAVYNPFTSMEPQDAGHA